MSGDVNYSSAIQDFHRLRNQATLSQLIKGLRGETTQLLSFEDVRKTLKLSGSTERGLKEIPLDAIVGSVGRYKDFTRDFLPTTNASAERWARVKAIADGLAGLPPIDVYKIGDIYFVKDGNHRVSVARQMGSQYIQAYVTEVQTRVQLTPDINPDDLILKAEYISFLEHTELDKLRPEADLSVTLPGQYQILLEHIDVHRYFMGIDYQRDIPYHEAVTHWFDTVYAPVQQTIRALGILRNFPNRTETDLYVWIAKHRTHLEESLGWDIQTEHAADDLVTKHGAAELGLLDRIGNRILRIVIPETLEEGPPPGDWRMKTEAIRPSDRLFVEVLVPVSGQDDGWNALEQALILCKREQASIHGLHIVSTKPEESADAASTVRQEFNRRCQTAGVKGDLLISSGDITQQICQYAAISDLIITNLAHPPGEQALERLESGFRQLVQRCPRPVLATPGITSELNHALLAFDNSTKAREGLYIAAYLVGKWGIQLTVVSLADQVEIAEEILNQARNYLDENGIPANYLAEVGSVGPTLLQIVEAQNCDFFIMGGYGLNPVLEVVLGSTVDYILRESNHPILICR